MSEPEDSSTSLQARKRSHLAQCLDPGAFDGGADLRDVALPYDALWEAQDVDTHASIVGVRADFPLMIGAMTGGTAQAASFNTALRTLARTCHLPMCLGSIRACLCDESLVETYGEGHVEALFANIGAAELEKHAFSLEAVARTCERLGCRGIFIHLNGLQEFVQDEGEHDFVCHVETLSAFCKNFPLPVFVKEVGVGLGGRCAAALGHLPVAGLETSSRGGTSWIKIENARRKKPLRDESLRALGGVGYTLSQAIGDCRRAMGKDRTVIASGGIIDPLLCIKALAAGADMVAMARPLYMSYHKGGEPELFDFVEEFIEIARLIWRSTGARTLDLLQTCGAVPHTSFRG